MFRPAIVLTLLVGAVLGCSKKNDSSNLEGGGDPNATYTLTFRTAQKGDRYEVVKTRNATATTKTKNSTQTKKEEFRYEFTETILDTSPDERLPTSVTRVYKTAERNDATGKLKSASYVGKTINIERYMKGYKFAADGKSLPPTEQLEINEDFNRGGWKLNNVFPKSPVKIGEEWQVDFAEITALAGRPQGDYNKEKSKFTGKLTRVYEKDGRQHGMIELNILLVLESPTAKGPPVTGSIETDVTFDVVIDGSTTAGTQKLTLHGTIEGHDTLGNAVTTSIDGTQEQSITPAK